MRLILPLLLCASAVLAQTPCEDFLAIIGHSDIGQMAIDFQTNCGPFDETVSDDGITKTWKSKKKGVTVTFTKDIRSGSDEFLLSEVLLESSTSKGGYTGQLPFGLKKEMDAHDISKHIKKRTDMEYTDHELGISRSYFTYIGKINEVTEGRSIKIYLEQYRGSGITSMRLTLK